MSNPTANEYLQPDYDATALKIAQLRGILLERGVTFSSAAKKGELVQAFDDNIKVKAPELLAAVSRVRPSNKGFIAVSEDGDENPAIGSGIKRPRGRPRKTVPEPVQVEDMTEPPPKKLRRPKTETDDVEVEVEIPSPARKRRGRAKKLDRQSNEDAGAEAEIEDDTTPAPRSTRSRASIYTESPASVPSAPSSSRHHSLKPSSAVEIGIPEEAKPHTVKTASKTKSEPMSMVMEDVKEESEKEEELPRKTNKIKTPRRSAGEDSGFSDYNPFQSGSEQAAERERRRRKSSLVVSRSKPAQPRFSEPAATAPHTAGLRRVGPSRENLKTPPKDVKQAMQEDKELSAAQEYNRVIQAKLNLFEAEDDESEPRISVSTLTHQRTPIVKGVTNRLPAVAAPRSVIPLSALLLLLLSFLANFKLNSASLGYCDSNSNTNDIILTRHSALDDANSCIDRRTQLDLETPGAGKSVNCDVSALPLVPFLPTPVHCAICPQHAVCDAGNVMGCEPEYILSAHPFSVLSPVADGLPGLGPRAFPPTCRPDTVKKRLIGGLAKAMEQNLARGRGLVVCAGMGKADGRKGLGERFGIEESILKEQFSARRDPKFSQEQFDEIFEAALKDLVAHEDVIEFIDIQGRSWYAASRTEMSIGCQAKLEFVDLLSRWKSQLGSTAAVLATIALLRSQFKSRREEKYQAEQLVQVVLRRLQDQERMHYSDPVTTSNPFIPPAQLRDVVMPPSGSAASRTRLWQRVQDLVEANANVAVREREVRGEMWKTWEWQGVGERRVTWA